MLAAALLALALSSQPGAGQGLILPRPEERTLRDCDACPLMVALPRGFLISQAPVTRAEFRVFAEATGFAQPNWGCKWNAAGIEQADDHPVVCVSHQDAEAYAAWLAERTGRAYRLPGLVELRYAALANQDANYWWGQSAGQNRANCTGCGSAWDGRGTSPVDSFPKNPFHLQDAVGNVWIWTSDCVEAGCAERQLVGGGWANPPADLRVTKTIWNGVAIPFNTYGMRVVRDAD